MEYESNNWIWEGAYYYTHLFGGIMIIVALLGLSTTYFFGIGFQYLPYLWPGFGLLKNRPHEKKRIRVYMDGCFDLMHYGHANALRQAKALGDELIVGVVDDDEILAHKGPAVLSLEERLALVGGLKWVDEVIPCAPYAITEQFMKTLFNEYKVDYIIHGDDPCFLPDGTDAYALAKKAGRYKQIKRTEGVSSTDIVGRILATVADTSALKDDEDPGFHDGDSCKKKTQNKHSQVGHVSRFLPTSRRIVQFSNGKGPAPNARVVYIDGAFDLFHAGHVEILRAARQLGDFLLVGIYTDHTVSEIRGPGYPLMSLHERCLSVLGCRYVDDVILGAPWEVTNDMMKTFNICLVVRGTVSETNPFVDSDADPYSVPKKMGIFRILESPKNITTSCVAQRIMSNHEAFMKRNAKKVVSERKYYEEKTYVSGD